MTEISVNCTGMIDIESCTDSTATENNPKRLKDCTAERERNGHTDDATNENTFFEKSEKFHEINSFLRLVTVACHLYSFSANDKRCDALWQLDMPNEW